MTEHILGDIIIIPSIKEIKLKVVEKDVCFGCYYNEKKFYLDNTFICITFEQTLHI